MLTRASFQEQLKGFVLGSNKNRFIVRRRQRGTKVDSSTPLWKLLWGPEVVVSLTKGTAVGWRESVGGESYWEINLQDVLVGGVGRHQT